VLDRYVLAKARQLVEHVTSAMDRNDLAGATTSISAFLDALTNWYVRRSRERFWRSTEGGGSAGNAVGDEAAFADKRDAYDTLHTVLHVMCRVAAPFLPFLSEEVYRGLTGERSVHLTAWPEAAHLPADDELVSAMDLVREVCSAGHSIRKAAGLRARLPLRSLTVAGRSDESLARLADLIVSEVNVKEVRFSSEVGDLADEVLVVVPAMLGPRIGGATQTVIGAARRGEWARTPDGAVDVGGVRLHPGEYSLQLRPVDDKASRLLPSGTSLVVLDLDTDAELENEGVARDLVRLIQQARRDAGLNVTDRITVRLGVPPSVAAAVETWLDYIAAQVLANEIELLISDTQVGAGYEAGLGRDEGVSEVSIQLEPTAPA
jgi:isoleucyl-tRNA synthetase